MYVEEVSAVYDRESIKTTGDAGRLLSREFFDADREYMIAVNVDSGGRPISYHIVNAGCLNQISFPVANVFKTAIIQNANSILLCHNHPGGTLEASTEDVEMTKLMVEIGRTLGIRILDHFILAKGQYISLREEMPEIFT